MLEVLCSSFGRTLDSEGQALRVPNFWRSTEKWDSPATAGESHRFVGSTDSHKEAQRSGARLCPARSAGSAAATSPDDPDVDALTPHSTRPLGVTPLKPCFGTDFDPVDRINRIDGVERCEVLSRPDFALRPSCQFLVTSHTPCSYLVGCLMKEGGHSCPPHPTHHPNNRGLESPRSVDNTFFNSHTKERARLPLS